MASNAAVFVMQVEKSVVGGDSGQRRRLLLVRGSGTTISNAVDEDASSAEFWWRG